MIPRVLRMAAFAVFALLVAGCTSGGSEPGGTFTPTATYTPPSYSTTPDPPSSTSSPPSVATTGPNVRPGEKPPTLPAVGRTHTAAGARAVAVFYIQALDWGYATMDSTLAKSLYAKSCKGCARFVMSEFESEQHANQHYVGARSFVTGAQSVVNDHHNGANAVVDVTVSQAKGHLVASNHDVVRKVPAAHGDFRGWLGWRGGRWVIVDWKVKVHR